MMSLNVTGADAMIKAAVDHYGKLDILVNNAGILRDKSFLKMTDDMFDLVVKIHLRGTYLCTQTAAKHMKERGLKLFHCAKEKFGKCVVKLLWARHWFVKQSLWLH